MVGRPSIANAENFQFIVYTTKRHSYVGCVFILNVVCSPSYLSVSINRRIRLDSEETHIYYLFARILSECRRPISVLEK